MDFPNYFGYTTPMSIPVFTGTFLKTLGLCPVCGRRLTPQPDNDAFWQCDCGTEYRPESPPLLDTFPSDATASVMAEWERLASHLVFHIGVVKAISYGRPSGTTTDTAFSTGPYLRLRDAMLFDPAGSKTPSIYRIIRSDLRTDERTIILTWTPVGWTIPA